MQVVSLYRPQFGVLIDVTSYNGRENGAIILDPSYTLWHPENIGGIQIPQFKKSTKSLDRGTRYSVGGIKDFYVGSAEHIAKALKEKWPTHRIYADIIEQMNKPYINHNL